MNPRSPDSLTIATLPGHPLFQSQAYLLSRQGRPECAVVDPGDGSESLLRAIRARGLRPVAYLLTHAHIDHFAGLSEWRRAWPAPVWLHPADLPLYAAAAEQAAMFGISCPELPPVDQHFEPERPFAVDSLELEVRFTPGHSPGSVSLVAAAVAGARPAHVIVGDVLFCGGIGRTDLPGGDYQTLLSSIRGQLLSLPDDTVVLSGHGPATTIGRERRTNPFLTGQAY